MPQVVQMQLRDSGLLTRLVPDGVKVAACRAGTHGPQEHISVRGPAAELSKMRLHLGHQKRRQAHRPPAVGFRVTIERGTRVRLKSRPLDINLSMLEGKVRS